MTRFRFVVCKGEVEEVVNSGASRGNSSFFSKLSTAGGLPAKGGQEEAREDCNVGGGGSSEGSNFLPIARRSSSACASATDVVVFVFFLFPVRYLNKIYI